MKTSGTCPVLHLLCGRSSPQMFRLKVRQSLFLRYGHPTIIGDIMGISTNPYEWGHDRPEGNWFPTYHHLQNRLDIMGPAKTLIYNIQLQIDKTCWTIVAIIIYSTWSRWYSESSGVSESGFFHSTMISRNMQTHTTNNLMDSDPVYTKFLSLCVWHALLQHLMCKSYAIVMNHDPSDF